MDMFVTMGLCVNMPVSVIMPVPRMVMCAMAGMVMHGMFVAAMFVMPMRLGMPVRRAMPVIIDGAGRIGRGGSDEHSTVIMLQFVPGKRGIEAGSDEQKGSPAATRGLARHS